MEDLVQQVVRGLAIGGVYGILALAVVIVYRVTSIPNFAAGEMALLTTFLGWELSEAGAPPLVVFVTAVLLGAGLGSLLERLIFRHVAHRSILAAIIAAIGVFVVLKAVMLLAGWGNGVFAFPSLLPGDRVSVFGTSVAAGFVWAIVFTLVLAGGLYHLVMRTDLGLAMRALASDHDTAALLGVRTGRVANISWTISGAIGSLAGLIIAPITFLHVDLMFSYLLKAFVAAAIGGFLSLPGALLGGSFLGVVENIYSANGPGELTDAVSFAMVLLVLLLRPQGLLRRASTDVRNG